MIPDFAAKLALVLKAVSLSRGRLAADLGVDKSVVSRWASGVNAPSGENLVQLTRCLAARLPGFNGTDWDLDAAAFAARVGATLPVATVASGPKPMLHDVFGITGAGDETRTWGHIYAGRWRQWRLSSTGDRVFMREHGLHRLDDDRLAITVTARGYALHGAAQVFRQRLSVWVAAPQYGIVFTSTMNGLSFVTDPVMTGIMTGCEFDQAMTPFAMPTVIERLPLDDRSDAEFLHDSRQLDPIVAEEDVPSALVPLLLADVGPRAHAAAIGPAVMRVGPPPRGWRGGYPVDQPRRPHAGPTLALVES